MQQLGLKKVLSEKNLSRMHTLGFHFCSIHEVKLKSRFITANNQEWERKWM